MVVPGSDSSWKPINGTLRHETEIIEAMSYLGIDWFWLMVLSVSLGEFL